MVNDVGNMSVGGGNEGGLILEDADVMDDAEDLKWSLVVRFLTEKAIHFESMQHATHIGYAVEACEGCLHEGSGFPSVYFPVFS